MPEYGKDGAVLVLSSADVEAVLDRDALIEAVAAGLAELSAGAASMPSRVAADVAERDGLLAAMPGHLPGARALGAKLVSVFPGNSGTRWPTHQAVVVLFDPATGAPEALLDGTVLTAERTAAASAVATRLLAGPSTGVVAVLGTGAQARAHALTVPRVCHALVEVRIAGRTWAKAVGLAEELAPRMGVPVRAVPSFAEAMSGAGVVCAATYAREPVVRRELLAPGAHVNSVGFHTEGREIDAGTVLDALVVVESRASALAPVPAGSNDLRWPIRDGVVDEGHIGTELGELVLGTRPGRASPGQLTLFKSVGVAVEDLAAAALVVGAARARGVGRSVDL